MTSLCQVEWGVSGVAHLQLGAMTSMILSESAFQLPKLDCRYHTPLGSPTLAHLQVGFMAILVQFRGSFRLQKRNGTLFQASGHAEATLCVPCFTLGWRPHIQSTPAPCHQVHCTQSMPQLQAMAHSSPGLGQMMKVHQMRVQGRLLSSCIHASASADNDMQAYRSARHELLLWQSSHLLMPTDTVYSASLHQTICSTAPWQP